MWGQNRVNDVLLQLTPKYGNSGMLMNSKICIASRLAQVWPKWENIKDTGIKKHRSKSYHFK